jgi:hypothetical protein
MSDQEMIKHAEVLLQGYALSCLTCKHFGWNRFNDDARYKAGNIKGEARYEFYCHHEPPMRDTVIVTDFYKMEIESDGFGRYPLKPQPRPRTVAYIDKWNGDLHLSQDMYCRLADLLLPCDAFELRRYRVITEFLDDTDLGEEGFARFNDLSIDAKEARNE